MNGYAVRYGWVGGGSSSKGDDECEENEDEKVHPTIMIIIHDRIQLPTLQHARRAAGGRRRDRRGPHPRPVHRAGLRAYMHLLTSFTRARIRPCSIALLG